MALTEPTRVHRTAVNAPQPPTAATVRLPMAPLAQPPQVWWPRIQPTIPGARSVRPVRIGDTERSAACDLLTLHFSEGRLAEDEFEQRLEAAVAARYSSELRQLFDDLPRQGSRRAAPQAAAAPSAPAKIAAVLLAVTTAMICLLMVAGIGAYEGGLGVAAMFGGVLAATGGAAIGWLYAHRGTSRHRP